jgi:hypothetical protein
MAAHGIYDYNSATLFIFSEIVVILDLVFAEKKATFSVLGI